MNVGRRGLRPLGWTAGPAPHPDRRATVGARTDHGSHRPGGGERDGAERERADQVERTYPGQCTCRYPLLRHGVGERAANSSADPREQRPGRDRDNVLTERRAPARAGDADVWRLTGQARMSYRRAAEIFTALTRPLDPDGKGWTLHQFSACGRPQPVHLNR